MKFRVLYNPEVYDDLKEAMDWYEERQSGLIPGGILFNGQSEVSLELFSQSLILI
jgi:hypothetical protein